MRRAISPTIWVTPTRSPRSVSSVISQRTFSASARRLKAARYFSPPRSTATTRPATGARFTCTLKTERKMPTRMACVPSGRSISPASSTRPSAGATTVRSSPGSSRGGFRKKNATKRLTPRSA